MKNSERQKVMDSLTQELRRGIVVLAVLSQLHDQSMAMV